MNWRLWGELSRLPKLLAAPRPAPAQYARRILALQRNVVLPAKLLVIAVASYYLYSKSPVDKATYSYGVMLDTMRAFSNIYLCVNLLAAVSFFVVRRCPDALVQWVVFATGLADGLFLAGLTLLSGGFDSTLFWAFPGLIVLNAFCIPLATPQLALNIALSIFYLGAGLLEAEYRVRSQTTPAIASRRPIPALMPDEVTDPRGLFSRLRRQNDDVSRLMWKRIPETTRLQLAKLLEENRTDELHTNLVEALDRLLAPAVYDKPLRRDVEPLDDPTEPFLLKLAILWLLAACCYGVQVLIARQQLAEEEQKEFTARTEQLHSAGRLAAEVAHQIKNPLAIINNTAFSLQRSLQTGRGGDPAPHIRIIQEEIEKADRIITQVMGYAELSEGRVEKLSVVEELDRAIDHVFPPGLDCGTKIRRDYATSFPPLLMQRRHLGETLVNLLQNARDVLAGGGHIVVVGRVLPDHAVEIVVADDGPGIPEDKFERVFEAYYTTRPKGTGLGLAIVKHNVELYGGTVRVESELGKGARFTVVFPAKAAIKLSNPS